MRMGAGEEWKHKLLKTKSNLCLKFKQTIKNSLKAQEAASGLWQAIPKGSV